MTLCRQPDQQGLADDDGGAGAVREADANERGPAGGTVPGQAGHTVPGQAEGPQGVPGGAQ